MFNLFKVGQIYNSANIFTIQYIITNQNRLGGQTKLLTSKCVFLESTRAFYSKLSILLALTTQGNRYSENSEHLILDTNKIKKTTF